MLVAAGMCINTWVSGNIYINKGGNSEVSSVKLRVDFSADDRGWRSASSSPWLAYSYRCLSCLSSMSSPRPSHDVQLSTEIISWYIHTLEYYLFICTAVYLLKKLLSRATEQNRDDRVPQQQQQCISFLFLYVQKYHMNILAYRVLLQYTD